MSLWLTGVVRFWSFNTEYTALLEEILSFPCHFNSLETNVEPILKQVHWEDTALGAEWAIPLQSLPGTSEDQCGAILKRRIALCARCVWPLAGSYKEVSVHCTRWWEHLNKWCGVTVKYNRKFTHDFFTLIRRFIIIFMSPLDFYSILCTV